MSPWFLLAAVPIFVTIVMVHEFGHFITAKWAGIRVEEFGLGFPPRLAGIKRGETIYSINWLPLGGFVRMPGENGETTDANGAPDPGSFAAKPAGKRLIVLLAGVTMNVVLAVVLFAAADAIGQIVDYDSYVNVQSGSPAAHAGLRSGDHILAIDGRVVSHFSDIVTDVGAIAQHAPHGAATVPVVLVVRDPGAVATRTLTVAAIVKPAANQGHLGVSPSGRGPVVQRVSVWQAPLAGVRDVGTVIGSIFGAFAQIVAGKLAFSQAFMGPVGIVTTSGEAASIIPQAGWYPIVWLTGALSVSLAVANVLPIPALDGGRVLLVLIEVARRGKRLTPEREGLINLVGFAFVLSLLAVITYFDVGRIVGGH
jgi:regulator of sigma E protease